MGYSLGFGVDKSFLQFLLYTFPGLNFFFTVRYVNEYLINLNRRNPFKTDYTLYL